MLVGPDEVQYIVHKDIACESSEFFTAACNGEWKESVEKVIRLPEVEEETWIVYLSWLYRRDIGSHLGVGPDTDSTTYTRETPSNDAHAVLDELIDAYAFAEMIMSADFRDGLVSEALDILVRTNDCPTAANILRLWQKIPRRSMMSRLFTDAWIGMDTQSFENALPDFTPEFVQEFALRSMAERDLEWKSRDPSRRDKCYYHEHEDGSESCWHAVLLLHAV